MKAVKLILVIMIVSLFSGVVSAQVSIGINIGSPRYYYLPEIEAYYDIQASMYLYLFGGRWIHGRVLPASYGHYDYNNSHRVIINDYRGNRPYSYFRDHRSRFPKGYSGGPEQSHWSMKEHKAQGKNFRPQGKEFQKENKKQNKEFHKAEKRNDKGNGNRSNGGGRGNGKGNGGGNGHGNGNKK
jgi:hypothetical protein